MTTSNELDMLPYGDPWARISRAHLESVADGIVHHSSLITRVASGDMAAVKGYLRGFWPYVSPFSSNIYNFNPPLRVLIKNLGADRARECLTGIMDVFTDMAQEEGEHSKLWEADAKYIGLLDLDGEASQYMVMPAVQELIDRSRSNDPVVRLALLSATEGMAEALSRRLTKAPKFTAILGGNYRWGDAHMMEHPGPSHYQCDLGLLEACLSKGPPDEGIVNQIETMVKEVLEIFNTAANQVEASFCSSMAHAAE